MNSPFISYTVRTKITITTHQFQLLRKELESFSLIHRSFEVSQFILPSVDLVDSTNSTWNYFIFILIKIFSFFFTILSPLLYTTLLSQSYSLSLFLISSFLYIYNSFEKCFLLITEKLNQYNLTRKSVQKLRVDSFDHKLNSTAASGMWHSMHGLGGSTNAPNHTWKSTSFIMPQNSSIMGSRCHQNHQTLISTAFIVHQRVNYNDTIFTFNFLSNIRTQK